MSADPSQPSALERLQALGTPGQPTAPPSRIPRRGIVGGLLVLGGILWKAKALLAGIKLASFATTASTMLFMAWTYSLFYGWPFAAGFVVLILVHELGHGVAALRVGLKVGAPVFVPFFGAFISLRQRPRSTFQDFVIGAGGPVAGSAGGAICLLLSLAVADPAAGLLRALGYFTLILNMFNLTPVWQLDGARMVTPIRVRASIAGFAALGVVLAIAVNATGAALNPIALLIVVLGLFRAANRSWRESRTTAPSSALARLGALSAAATAIPDDGVTAAQRRIAWAVYFGLAAALVIAVHSLPRFLPVVG